MLAEDAPRIVALATAGPGHPVLGAVAAQTRLPDEVRPLTTGTGGRAGAFAAALAAGAGEDVDWWWLLDGCAIPRPDALERLIEPLSDLGPLPAPVLLAGKIVGPGGELDPERAPWPRLLQKEVSLDACERRLVSVRAARHGSLLVHRDAVRRHGPPRADYVDAAEDLEWTARMLRDGSTGYLVPSSVAQLVGAPEPAPVREARRRRDLGNRVNMLRGTAWDGEEKLWFGFLLAQDLAGDIRRHPGPRSLARAAGEVRRGLRLPGR